MRERSDIEGALQVSEETQVVDNTLVPVGGDVMTAIDGTELLTEEDLGSYLALQTHPRDTVEWNILRDGAEQTVDLQLETRPEEITEWLYFVIVIVGGLISGVN